MASHKSLYRLLDIRKAQEKSSQTEMETAIAELQHLESAYAMTHERGKFARTLLASSAQTGELMDRIAGLQEITTVARLQRMLMEMIDIAEEKAENKRRETLARRLARRQVETLVDTKLAEARAEANRKTQSALDDWHRSRRKPATQQASAQHIDSDISLTE
jgi:flagellar export protein FliJ